MTQFRIALAILSLLFIAGLSTAQDFVEFRVTSVRPVERRLALHRRIYVDWETTFSITNKGQKDVIVFGMDLGNGRLDPVQYGLLYDNKTQTWKYPNSDNAPTPWKDVSDVMKHAKVLVPGESLSFTRQHSREMRCGEKVMLTAQIGYPKSKRTLEIRSEEYLVPCLDTKVPFKPPTVGTAEQDEILNTLDLFWKAALSGDEALLSQRIRKRPLELWPADKETRHPKPQDKLSATREGSPDWVAQMRDLSRERWGGTFWFLRTFAKDIHTYNLQLLKAEVSAASKNEALVNVHFANETMKVKDKSATGRLVLLRDDSGWKVVSMQPIGEMNYR